MAEAYGKLTSRPGICFVTRGPGATNASHGVHIAAQNSTPMILFIGQVARDMRARPSRRWTTSSSSAAWRSGWPRSTTLPLSRADRSGLPAQMVELLRLLEEAHGPLAIPGGSRWTEAARTKLVAWSERWVLPVVTSFRRATLFLADHPTYVGDVGIGPNPKLAARVKESDLLLLILLHAARHSRAGAAPRTCASGSGGAGPGVRAHACHPGFARCLLRGLARDEPGADAILAQRGGHGARHLSRLVGAPESASRVVLVWRSHGPAAGSPTARCGDLQQGRQLLDLDSPLLSLLRLRQPAGSFSPGLGQGRRGHARLARRGAVRRGGRGCRWRSRVPRAGRSGWRQGRRRGPPGSGAGRWQ